MIQNNMDDPRAENCKAFKIGTNNQVVGVELQYRELPSSRYKLALVELIDEATAQGNTVAKYTVMNEDGISVSEPVRLAWPWPELTTSALSGNPHNEHVITNGYTPPDLGPLAMYVSDKNGEPISDIIGGLGLPYNRHICFNIVWIDRASDSGNSGNGGTVIDNTEVLVVLNRIAATLDNLATHLGAV